MEDKNNESEQPDKQAESRQFGGKTSTSWKPGQSGNPTGRPKNEACITAMLRNELGEIADVTLGDGTKNTEKTWAELIVDAVLRGAAMGDGRLTKELLDRLEGRVPMPHEITGEPVPLKFEIEYVGRWEPTDAQPDGGNDGRQVEESPGQPED